MRELQEGMHPPGKVERTKAGAAMNLNSMPFDILELILLYLDSPTCLVRASSTCKLWRRIIADAVFLHRFRSLHEPPVVGFYHNSDQFITSRPSFEAAAPPPLATIGRRYFSLDDGLIRFERLRTWTVKDSRGGLLLLEKGMVKGSKRHRYMFVVEPFTRRMEKIVAVLATPTSDRRETQAFFLDDDGANNKRGGEIIGMSNFRVVCLSLNGSEAAIITHGGSYRKVRTGNDQGKEMVCLGSAAGSMYWYTKGGTMFALEKSTAQFSSFSLPINVVVVQADSAAVQPTTTISSSKFAVTTGCDGEPRIVFLADDKLKIFARLKARGDWVLEKSVLRPNLGVPSAQNFYFGRSVPLSDDTMGTVKMIASSAGKVEKPAAFNLDIDKKQVKRTKYGNAYPIRLPWTPSMRACTAA